jgi:hypothetical protein
MLEKPLELRHSPTVSKWKTGNKSSTDVLWWSGAECRKGTRVEREEGEGRSSDEEMVVISHMLVSLD